MTHTLTRPSRPAPPAAPSARFQAPPAAPRSAEGAIHAALGGFAPISLAEMDAVALLNRTDSKYVLPAALLAAILPRLLGDYRVLELEGRRAHRYHTLYFDTADFELYRQHHAGRRVRYKVRSRAYLDSGRAFLEIKQKTSAERTVKQRLATAGLLAAFDEQAAGFVARHAPLDPRDLAPRLWNDFSRITLVSLGAGERVTLDLGLCFGRDGRRLDLPGVAVAEIKRAGFSNDSAMMRQLRQANLHQGGFSKYCAGAALLYDTLPRNNLKPALRRVAAITKESRDV
ncbi:MAG TPA: polyphosphate polymerase domain-containing protein [Herpetosiphonaceae bacterium]